MNSSLPTNFHLPSDGWYQIEAKGTFRNGSVVQVIDDEACQDIVDDFNAHAANPGFAGMLIDHEHFKHDQTKETVAYGWLERLEYRPDGIYGQIRWTATGKAAVEGGEYRYFSTEYNLDDCEEISDDGMGKTVRPHKLDGLTLTNMPNNRDGQKPITNRESDACKRPSSSFAADLAKTYQQRNGGTFENAWNIIRNRHPHLFGLKSEPVTGNYRQISGPSYSQDSATAERRREAVENYKINNRCTHEQATNAVRLRKPELFGLPKK